MRKLNKKTGFTLAELLIVVAIIAILVAIGIPAFSTAMERSRETVDLANIRGAYAEYMAETLSDTTSAVVAYPVDFKQRNSTNPTATNGWIVDVKGFLPNVTNDKMPQCPGPGEGYVVFSYTGSNDKPTVDLKAKTDTLPTGAKVISITS